MSVLIERSVLPPAKKAGYQETTMTWLADGNHVYDKGGNLRMPEEVHEALKTLCAEAAAVRMSQIKKSARTAATATDGTKNNTM